MTSGAECFCNIVTLVSRRQGRKPPGSAGVPPAPKPLAVSALSFTRIDRLPHRRETERQPKGQD